MKMEATGTLNAVSILYTQKHLEHVWIIILDWQHWLYLIYLLSGARVRSTTAE
jgi:hypothetical protein